MVRVTPENINPYPQEEGVYSSFSRLKTGVDIRQAGVWHDTVPAIN